MNIEGDFFRGRAPGLIAKAVGVLPVGVRGEGMVACGDGALVDYVVIVRGLDLNMAASGQTS